MVFIYVLAALHILIQTLAITCFVAIVHQQTPAAKLTVALQFAFWFAWIFFVYGRKTKKPAFILPVLVLLLIEFCTVTMDTMITVILSLIVSNRQNSAVIKELENTTLKIRLESVAYTELSQLALSTKEVFYLYIGITLTAITWKAFTLLMVYTSYIFAADLSGRNKCMNHS